MIYRPAFAIPCPDRSQHFNVKSFKRSEAELIRMWIIPYSKVDCQIDDTIPSQLNMSSSIADINHLYNRINIAHRPGGEIFEDLEQPDDNL